MPSSLLLDLFMALLCMKQELREESELQMIASTLCQKNAYPHMVHWKQTFYDALSHNYTSCFLLTVEAKTSMFWGEDLFDLLLFFLKRICPTLMFTMRFSFFNLDFFSFICLFDFFA